MNEILPGYWLIRIPLFVGQVNIKPVKYSLFDERYGKPKTVVIGPFRMTWRRWRRTAE